MSEFGMSFEEAARRAKEGARAIREAMARDSYPVTAPDARQSDELRGLIAETLAARHSCDTLLSTFICNQCRRSVDALLPVVTTWAEAQARARAAEELRKAADDEDLDRRYVRKWLRDRAAALAADAPSGVALAADDRTDPA